MTVYLDPKVWGPHYWFFLHTVAMTYPHHPNTVTKKKYYEFIQNLPLFLPVQEISSEFSKLIDKYPITPYLDNRINQKLEKPQISLNEFYVKYYDEYKSENVKAGEYYKLKEKLVYSLIIVTIVGSIFYLYDK